MSRIQQQLAFLLTADQLKSVTRQNNIYSGDRAETVAEHSWHLTLMVLLFAEHAPVGTDIAHVLKLLVVHDLVEIYAGDHDPFNLNEDDVAVVAELEAEAAQRLFGMLPEDQHESLGLLWREFEARATPEARFARAIDALHPALMTWGPGSRDQSRRSYTVETALLRKRAALEPYSELWSLLRDLLHAAATKGLLAP